MIHEEQILEEKVLEERRRIVWLAGHHRKNRTAHGLRVAAVLEAALTENADAIAAERALRVAVEEFSALARRIIAERESARKS